MIVNCIMFDLDGFVREAFFRVCLIEIGKRGTSRAARRVRSGCEFGLPDD